MSYILDALRRSQAERDRGQVPGLNAHPLPADTAPRGRRGIRTAWLAVGLALGLGVIGALWLWPEAPQPPPRPGLPPVAALAPSPVPAPVPPPQPLPAPLPTVVSAPAPAAAVAGPAPGAGPGAAPAKPAAAELRTVPWAELGAELRRELPPLALGGAIWSENAASRFVLVNGQVVREGEAAAPGVTLERIAPKSVLLRWREMRIEVPL
ncbi:MAG: general secretion pathway protein GspB [Rubrivivax sp.]|nr:general secretion pathway protein GspB [Rubrivivax sp.]